MASSASSPRIGRGSVDSALILKSQTARPPVAGDNPRTAGSHRDVPEPAPRAVVLDARWQSLIDAATD